MRSFFERMFSPSEEASSDPRVVIEATLAAEKRLRQYESERAIRMAEYERKWPGSKAVGSHVVAFDRDRYTREAR